MKLRLDSPVARLTVDLPDEQVFEILGIALDYATGFSPEEVPVVKEPPKPTPPPVPKEIPVSTPAPAEEPKKEISKESTSKPEFKGFLYIKCEECGKFRAFMPKTPIHKYKCDCGHTTHLENMVAMKVNCKCGAQFKYLTNALDNQLTIDCYSCGSPVDLEYHERKQEYLTII